MEGFEQGGDVVRFFLFENEAGGIVLNMLKCLNCGLREARKE